MKRASIGWRFGHTNLTSGTRNTMGAYSRLVLLAAICWAQPCHGKECCQGLEKAHRGDAEIAEAFAEKAAQNRQGGPGAADRHLSRGLSLLEKQEVDAAISEFKAAINLKPGFAPAFNAMGLALERKGEAGAAVDVFKKATELDPTLYTAFRNLGMALQHTGDLDGALAAFK